MPKLLSAKRSNPKGAPAAKKPARRLAAVYQVVRGSARNPHPMMLQSSQAGAKKAAAWLRSHFPSQKFRVVKLDKEKAR